MNKKQLLEEIISLKQDLEERTLLVTHSSYEQGYNDCLEYVLDELQELLLNA